MKSFIALLLAAGCSRTTEPTAQGPTNERTATPLAAPVSEVDSSPPPLGGAAEGPKPSTPARVKARSCEPGKPTTIGTADEAIPAMAAVFGPKNGLVAWTPRDGVLAVRPVDLFGRPNGPAQETAVPANLDRALGLRALNGKYLAFLRELDFSEQEPVTHVFAIVLDPDGASTGSPLRIALGKRSTIDGISDGAAHGVLIFAGASPSTEVDTARLVRLYVEDGVISQSFRDFPDPSPGARVSPLFSFSKEHAVTVLESVLVVDGVPRPIQDESTPPPPGFGIAPSFAGKSAPIYAATVFAEDPKIRYGSLSLDGMRRYAVKEYSLDAPLKRPLEAHVWWGTTAGDNDVKVFGSVWPTGAPTDEGISLAAAMPDLSSGVWTQVVWSGEQALVLYSEGPTVRIAPLPCN